MKTCNRNLGTGRLSLCSGRVTGRGKNRGEGGVPFMRMICRVVEKRSEDDGLERETRKILLCFR